MINQVKQFVKSFSGYNRMKFFQTCDRLGLSLDYQKNKQAATLFYNIFLQKEYADYFPFYEQATVVDIGGHFGFFSMFASRNLAQGASIYVYEPHPSNYQLLVENIERNKIQNVAAFQLAVSNQKSMKTLYEHTSYNHSINTNSKKTIQVESIQLADISSMNKIEKIDFLKMDCEGAEYDILLHADSSVFNKITTISLEFHDLREQNVRPQQLVNKLVNEGFDMKKYTFSDSYSGSNYGRIIASKLFIR